MLRKDKILCMFFLIIFNVLKHIKLTVTCAVVSEGDNSWLDNKLSPEVIVFLALACIALVTATVIIILVCQRRKKNPETDYIVKKFTK